MRPDLVPHNYRGIYPRPDNMPQQYITVRMMHYTGLWRPVLMMWNSESGIFYGCEYGDTHSSYETARIEAQAWAEKENLEVM